MTDAIARIRRWGRDLARFGRGACASGASPKWCGLLRPGALRDFDLLSLDVFETILARSPGTESAVRRESAAEARRLCGLRPGQEPNVREVAVLRRGVERRLRQEARAAGRDPEVTLAEIHGRLLAVLGGGPPDPAAVAALCAFERAGELLRTCPNRDVVELMARAAAGGLRVVAVTDMYFTADDLAWLLGQHGVSLPSRLYVSSEFGLGKFSGRLFREVLRAEGVEPSRALHVGDRLLNDVLAPRSEGLRAVRYLRPKTLGPSGAPEPLPPHPAPLGDAVASPGNTAERAARVLGETVLGPVLGTFARQLLVRANRSRVDRLLFVARDGELLQQVFELVQGSFPVALRLPTRYVHLSRRSTNLAALERLERGTVDDVFAVTTTHRTLGAVLAALNLDPGLFRERLAAHGLDDVDTPLDGGASDPRLARILEDGPFQATFASEAARQKALLERYLRQEGFFDGGRIALVDVGWRGSTQTSLQRAFGGMPGFCELTGFYVGLWPDDAVPMLPDLEAKEGLISDCRRARTPLEGAAHYVSLLLEAACRAEHGTVLGYAEDASGAVRSVVAMGTGDRRAEEEAVPVARAIRAGALASARSQVASPPIRVSPERERREAQKALLRLAFFPTRDEIEVGRSLVHTDRFSEGWHKTLLPREPASPFRQPQRWVSQLQSPWRAGVVAQTGGWPLSTLHLLLESVLVGLPGGIRAALQRFLLSAAGLTSGGKR